MGAAQTKSLPLGGELVFLANANARMGEEGARSAAEALAVAGFQLRETTFTATEQEFEVALDAAIASGCPLIAVGGGDGTLRHAAERIAGTATALAVVPLGTGNSWAKDLGFAPNPVDAASQLACAEPTRIDLGQVNGHGFVNVATIGLTSLIVKNLPKGIKGAFGRLAYLPAVLKSFSEVRPFWLTVQTDREQFSGKALLFVAAAGRTHAGPFPVTRHAVNDDGLLSLYVLHDTGRFGLLRFGLALLLGRHTRLNEVWSAETATATVRTAKPRRVIVDGEPFGHSPLDLAVKPHALTVLVPRPESPG